MPENWDAVMLFCNVSTQWVWLAKPVGGAIRIGLNYPGVRASRADPIPDVLFRQLQVMEFAALEVCRSDDE